MSTLVGAGLVVRRGERTILTGADLALAPGSLVLLAGRNGAGKSTLLRALAGLVRPDAGSVLLEGRPLSSWAARERAKRIALVPQDRDAPFEFTGRELALMGRHPHVARFATAGPRDHEAVEAALRAVDALGYADRPITTLSGGEARRIAIARALATEAPVLLADEPTSNLDIEHALALLDLLERLAIQGRAVLMASHDLMLAARRARSVALLHEGRVLCNEPAGTALSDERLRLVFGIGRRALEA